MHNMQKVLNITQTVPIRWHASFTKLASQQYSKKCKKTLYFLLFLSCKGIKYYVQPNMNSLSHYSSSIWLCGIVLNYCITMVEDWTGQTKMMSVETPSWLVESLSVWNGDHGWFCSVLKESILWIFHSDVSCCLPIHQACIQMSVLCIEMWVICWNCESFEPFSIYS